jgi:hypothetical protein
MESIGAQTEAKHDLSRLFSGHGRRQDAAFLSRGLVFALGLLTAQGCKRESVFTGYSAEYGRFY